LTSSVHGKVEFIWRGDSIPTALRALGEQSRTTGDTVRMVVAEEKQDSVLDLLRRERLHLISMNPVRASLEDYFMEKLQPTPQEAAEMRQ
jgi:hypothetical protein